jgi:hypothetical protein
MAKRKKRVKVQRRKSATVRGKARKGSKFARGKAKKRTIAKANPRRAAVKKAAKIQRIKQEAPAVETVVVDVIGEPVPGVITVTEFEETEVRERIRGRDEPEEC